MLTGAMIATRSARPRIALRYILRILLAVGLLVVAVVAARDLSWRHVLAMTSGLPLPTIVLAAVASVLQAVVLATRLWAVFPHRGRPRWASVARAFGFGQLTNAFVPGRAGDVVKVVAMRNDENTTATDATGVVLADKAFDMITLGLLVVVLAPALLLGVVAGAMHFGWMAPILAVAAFIVLALLRKVRPAARQKLREGAAATWRSLRGLATPRRLVSGLALGCASWLAEAGSMMLLAHPMGLHLSLAHAIASLLVLNLGIALPVSFANVGAYEAAMVVGLRSSGATATQALAIGTLHHLMQIGAIALFALVFWLRDHVAKAKLVAAPAAA